MAKDKKSVVTAATKKVKEFVIGDKDSCPNCGRAFKEHDLKAIADRKVIACLKCGSKLRRK